ncbi:DeoR/GlpR transcriptional regulator [Enterococcus sp. BWB1-3]|uniref:DeoR/GlpR family DNA-binding transcription regulator n=1 Tax=Enterococcus sp. BWB1-3 TaxID=2787713 RepID=UPI001922CFA2|nr:DeoR/GlpR transcriptional regulator [Enterococcus sp. BWB1-3]
MLTDERRYKILELIKEKQFVSVNDLADAFSVHETTIRRDLDDLEEKGLVARIHGGVIPSDVKKDESPFDERQTENIDEKERIGRYAASLIKDYDSIILDSGTTTLQIARHLTNQKNLTVITNDINIATVLRNNREVKTIVTGGVVHHNSYMLNGMLTDAALKNLFVNKAFIATPAFDLTTGLNHFDEYLIPAKKEMLVSAQNVIVVADHTKLGRKALHAFWPIEEMDLLITDTEADSESIALLQSKGLKIEQA